MLLLQVGYLKFEGSELAVNEGKLSVNYGFYGCYQLFRLFVFDFNNNFENCIYAKPITVNRSNKNDDNDDNNSNTDNNHKITVMPRDFFGILFSAAVWGQEFLLIQFVIIFKNNLIVTLKELFSALNMSGCHG